MEITREGKQQADPAGRRAPTAEESAAGLADQAVADVRRAFRGLKQPIPTAPKVDATAEETAKDEAAAEAWAAAKADAEIAIHAAEAEAATLRKAADESRAALDALAGFETDQQRDSRTVAGVNREMKRLALAQLDDAATLDDVRDHVVTICKNVLKAEIAADPAGRGYAGKTDAEAAALASDAYQDADGNPQTARIAAIFMGIPYAPNAITDVDVAEAR
jgi:hypothetical protein